MHVHVQQQGRLADVLHDGTVVLTHTYDGEDVSGATRFQHKDTGRGGLTTLNLSRNTLSPRSM